MLMYMFKEKEAANINQNTKVPPMKAITYSSV